MYQTERVIEWKAGVFHCGQLAEQISTYIKLHRSKGASQHSRPRLLAQALPGKEYMPSGKQTLMDDRLGVVSDRPAVSPAPRWQRSARRLHSPPTSGSPDTERSCGHLTHRENIRAMPLLDRYGSGSLAGVLLAIRRGGCSMHRHTRYRVLSWPKAPH